jgi:ribosomal protein S18 acetylase RimI-like enzyme
MELPEMKETVSSDYRIVPVAEKYIESYYKCLDLVARERRYLALVQAPPLESTRQFILSNIANGIPQFVALSSEEVVGWCDISPLGLEGFIHCGRLGMGVRDGFRRRGIGTRLFAKSIQRAKDRGLQRVELEVLASNTPAIKFYEGVGFVVEGVKKKARRLDGAYDDLIMMALFI